MSQAAQATEDAIERTTGVDNPNRDPVLQYVTFTLDGETYAVDVMQVQEVLKHTDIAPVPGAPGYVLGILNLRGNVVTVIDSRTRFGLEPGNINDENHIIIVESCGCVVGLLVDGLAEVVYLRQGDIETTPNVGNEDVARFITGVCHFKDQLYIVIDLNRLLTDEEIEELSQP